MSDQTGVTDEGWHADPEGTHEMRFHDGVRWTEHVSDAGEVSVAPMPPPPPPDRSGAGLAGRALGAAKDAAAAKAQRKAETERYKIQAQAKADAEGAARRATLIATGDLWEYKVEMVRETLVSDKIDNLGLQRMLNEHASDGWRVKAVTSASVTGRMGPGGVSGLLVTFERRVRA